MGRGSARGALCPGAPRGVRGPTIVPARADLRVRFIIVIGPAEVRASAPLLVQDHGLAVGADDADHQVAHEGVLHVHADAQQLIDVGERLARCTLGERERGVEAFAHVVRQEHATAQVGIGQFVPGGGVNGAVQAKCFAGAACCAGGAREGGLGAHQRHQVHQVVVGAAVVVQHVQLCGVCAGLCIRVVHHRRGIVQHGAVAEIPPPAGDVEAACRIGCAAVERHRLSGADLLRRTRAVGGHCGGATAGLEATDGGREHARPRIVRLEHHGEASAGIGSAGRYHLPLQGGAGPGAKQRCACAVSVVDRHRVDRCRAGQAQVEGHEVQRDRATRCVGTQGVGEVLVVAVSCGTLSAAVEQGARATGFSAVGDHMHLRLYRRTRRHHGRAKRSAKHKVAKPGNEAGERGAGSVHHSVRIGDRHADWR